MMRLLHCFLKLSSWVMFFPIGPRVIMWLAKIIPIRSRFNALKVTNVCTLKTIKGVITVLPGVLLCSTPELFCTVQLALVHWEKNAAMGYSFADSFNNSILILEVVYLVHSLIQSVPVRLQTSTLHSLSQHCNLCPFGHIPLDIPSSVPADCITHCWLSSSWLHVHADYN